MRPSSLVIRQRALLVDPSLAPELSLAVELYRSERRRHGLLPSPAVEELADHLADLVVADVGSDLVPTVDRSGSDAVEWVSVKGTAAQLGVGPRRVRYLLADGELRGRQVHARLWQVDQASIDEYRGRTAA